jgi:hypothetical protein
VNVWKIKNRRSGDGGPVLSRRGADGIANDGALKSLLISAFVGGSVLRVRLFGRHYLTVTCLRSAEAFHEVRVRRVFTVSVLSCFVLPVVGNGQRRAP